MARPDPFPNSAVKRSLANGSGCIASARVGRRQFFPYNAVLKIGTAFLLSGSVQLRVDCLAVFVTVIAMSPAASHWDRRFLLAFLAVLSSSRVLIGAPVDFNREVRPIFSEDRKSVV